MTQSSDLLNFDWDPAKNATNIRKHHLSFEFASLAFYDPNYCEIYDEDHSSVDTLHPELSEHRHIIIGFIKDVPLYISYTVLPDGTYWLINARKALRWEVEKYYIPGKR